MNGPEKSSQRLVVAGNQLLLDVATAEVVEALRGAGVRSILLKGPAIARWLYANPTDRMYGDSDLLVAKQDFDAARRVLADLGYEPASVEQVPGDRPIQAHAWIRPRDGVIVDLHYGIQGADAEPEVLWEVLSASTETIDLRGSEIEILALPARTVHVAVHAARHGRGRPIVDLGRALDQLPEELWSAAAGLARDISAMDAFVTGLSLLEEGRLLAKRLELPAPSSVDAALYATEAPPAAFNLQWLASRPTMRTKIVFVLRKTFPPVGFLRMRSPLARRGPLGLAAAYVWRPISLIIQIGPGFIAWLRARRSTKNKLL